MSRKVSPSRIARRASIDVTATIQPLEKAAAALNQRVGRFDIYGYLEVAYFIYFGWKRRREANRSARVLAEELGIVRRKGMSPIRVLIEATLPDADLKQKSRWVRALEYVYSENVSPSQFRKFVRNRGGLAGCAGLALWANNVWLMDVADHVERSCSLFVLLWLGAAHWFNC